MGQRTLALSVIAVAVADAADPRVSEDVREDARQFLSGSPGLAFWSCVAGVSADGVACAARRRWSTG